MMHPGGSVSLPSYGMHPSGMPVQPRGLPHAPAAPGKPMVQGNQPMSSNLAASPVGNKSDSASTKGDKGESYTYDYFVISVTFSMSV